MLVTGNFAEVQINYEPFIEKPPLFIWVQALSMKVFGVNEFAARFPNTIIGFISLLTFYFMGRKMYNVRFGFIWALCYFGSILPNLYFKSGIIDPLFNYFIFNSVFWIFYSIRSTDKPTLCIFLAGLSTGLAILTKGPLGLVLVILTVLGYWVLRRFRKIISLKNLFIFFLTAFLVSSVWYIIIVSKNGFGFLLEFIQYQLRIFSTSDAGHGQPFYYHFLVIAIGCFPISILAIKKLVPSGLFKAAGSASKDGKTSELINWMQILFWVVMILFSISVTKIVHYSSLAYFPLSFLAAMYLNELLEKKQHISRLMFVFLIISGSVLSLLIALLPVIFYYKDHIYSYIRDPFAVACLNTPVEWSGYEFLIGIIYFAALIYALYQIRFANVLRGSYFLFFSTAITLFFFLIIVAPKIENYSQGPAIGFYEKYSGQDVYMTSYGYKSYAQYFYFKKPQGQDQNSRDIKWLLEGNIDKPVYFVTKSTDIEKLRNFQGIDFIEQKGGYALFYRPR
ncbi:MAG: glycosyltransferase family 39 protein [Ignavibacteria bacterium]|nr:glycosyltransferase family 39 protein [Ignavibacteria bacterium]